MPALAQLTPLPPSHEGNVLFKSIIKKVQSLKYLGSALSADGRLHHELARRMGAALADFKTLAKIWNHSTLSRRRKLQIFDACVASKLAYGLHVCWLNKTERRRLDGFHCRGLRRILRIRPAYWSRVSNEEVFRRAASRPLSQIVSERQLLFMHKVANLPGDSLVRQALFEPDSTQLRRPNGVRRVGRPRDCWGAAVRRLALEIAGSEAELSRSFDGRANSWRHEIRRHFAHCT